MLAYPVDLERDTNGTLLVTFPDFAEAVTFGEDEGDALLRAEGALETVLAARIEDREDIPLPSPAAGRACAVLPALTAAKVDSMPGRPTGRHVVADLMAFYFRSSEANDLAYRARIGRQMCRSLEMTTHRPAPMA